MSTREPFRVMVCTECQAATYPPRAMCGCGGADWQEATASTGELQHVTHLRRVAGAPDAPDVVLGVVQLDAGPRVIVRVEGHLARGSSVALYLERGVAKARPIEKKKKRSKRS